jgi:diguanylate cyclase (GGDEF)-like protein
MKRAYLVGFIFLLFIFLYMYKEISLKKEYKLLLRKTQRILDAQDAIVVIVGREGLLDVNKKFLDFFGYASLEAFRLHHRCISDKFLNDSQSFHLHDFENKKEWIEKLSKMDNTSKIVSMMDKYGEVYYFSIKESQIDENYLIELSDISDTVKEKFRYISKAYTDALTGTYNREYFNTNIEKIINSQHNGSHLGIIFCDIDFFKKVNDTYGHEVGDKVLQKFVQILEKNIRSQDTIIRWGGEEFVILVSVGSMDILIKIANTLKEAVEAEEFELVGTLTCSFGLSSYVKGEDVLKAIKRADDALYEAKQSGRNRVKFKF